MVVRLKTKGADPTWTLTLTRIRSQDQRRTSRVVRAKENPRFRGGWGLGFGEAGFTQEGVAGVQAFPDVATR